MKIAPARSALQRSRNIQAIEQLGQSSFQGGFFTDVPSLNFIFGRPISGALSQRCPEPVLNPVPLSGRVTTTWIPMWISCFTIARFLSIALGNATDSQLDQVRRVASRS